ncbi:MAG: VWA domain-containing protein [Candidatus Syntrophosphaera sp.]|nr:VWA domain-containing protein [Candidatus Syntrophosphaera sp.]
MAIDISGSMLAMDFAPQNRLGAAVSVAKDFVRKRPNDRFGLVAFSEYALTQSPLTFDHNAMLRQLERLEVNQEASFTAIGLGLAKAVARLKDSSAKSRIVILITDGVSNTGEIDPVSAARMAREFGIKVYPIGVGSNAYVDYPMIDPRFGSFYGKVFVELDMETLDRVAEITGTEKAALASDREQLQAIMAKIDTLEKSDYSAQIRYVWAEQFMALLWAAFILILAELLLRLLFLPVLPES